MLVFVFDPITGEVKGIPRKFVEGPKKYDYNQECIFKNKSEIDCKTKRKLMAELWIEDEVFALVPNTDGVYVSNYGRVKRMKNGRLSYFYVPTYHVRMGGVYVKIIKNGVKSLYKVANLVAEVFDVKDRYEFYDGKKFIYHIDKNSWNNRVSNLIYVKNSDLAKEMNRIKRKEVAKVSLKTKEVIEYYGSITEAASMNFMNHHTLRRYIEEKIKTYDGCLLTFVKQ